MQKNGDYYSKIIYKRVKALSLMNEYEYELNFIASVDSISIPEHK